MAQLSGTVEDESGSAIEGATVYAIREFDNSLAGMDTTNESGEFLIDELDESEEYHVAASFDDGTEYAGDSFPFVEPHVATGPIDDFEDGDIAEYEGQTASFDVQSGTVIEGSFALQMQNDDGSPKEIRSLSGLPRYPTVGSAFQSRIYLENDAIAEMLFGVQDGDNKYRARVNSSSDVLSLSRREDGSHANLANESVTIPNNEWLELIVDWGDAEEEPIEVILNDESGAEVASISREDGTFTNGGIGWVGSADSFSGNHPYYDICELTRVGDDEEPGEGIEGNSLVAVNGWDGSLDPSVFVYDIGDDSWTKPTELQDSATQGGDAAHIGDGIIFRGPGSTDNLAAARYDAINNTEIPTTDYPENANECGVASTGGFVYATTTTDTFYRYDPGNDTWTSSVSNPPQSHERRSRAIAVDGYVYLVGGDGGDERALDRYDPDTDSWDIMADIPDNKYFHGCGRLNGEIYVTGGADNPRSCYKYNPSTDSWSQIADLPQDIRRHAAAGGADGRLYNAFGSVSSGDTDEIYAYDPDTDTWDTSLTPAPLAWQLTNLVSVNL